LKPGLFRTCSVALQDIHECISLIVTHWYIL
jgi:hypothetical protein